jgi:hypothetical protein
MAATIEQRSDEYWLILSDGADRRPSYALVHALGGWLQGFRPIDGRFESRLTFRDGSRAAPALAILRAAFDEDDGATGWATRRECGTTTVEFGGAADDELVATFQDLTERLSARGSALSGFAPTFQDERLVGFAVDDARLAEWLARALRVGYRSADKDTSRASDSLPEPSAARSLDQDRGGSGWSTWRQELATAIRNACLSVLWPSTWAPEAFAGRGTCPRDPDAIILEAIETGPPTRAVREWCVAATLAHRLSPTPEGALSVGDRSALGLSVRHRPTDALLPRAWYRETLMSRRAAPPALLSSANAEPRNGVQADEAPAVLTEQPPIETGAVDSAGEASRQRPAAGEGARVGSGEQAPNEPPPEAGEVVRSPIAWEEARPAPALVASSPGDSISLAIMELEDEVATSPREAERRARRLLAAVSGGPHEARLRLVLADALRRRGATTQELAELRCALAAGPGNVEEHIAAHALRRILEERACAAGEDAVVRRWLPDVAQIGADETLLLLAAEAATVCDRDLAATLLRRAVPGRGATIGPTEAAAFLDAVEIEGDRLKQLLVALDRTGFATESDTGRAVAELLGAFDPLDGEVLVRLVELDVTQGASWLSARLDRLLCAFGDEPEPEATRRVAGLVRPLADALDYLFGDDRVSVDTERLHRYAALAVRAALAVGEPSTAWTIVELARSPKRRLQRAQLVDLADQIAVHPTALDADRAQDLVDLYFGVGSELLDRRGRAGDDLLLEEVIRTLRDLDPPLAGELETEWRARDGRSAVVEIGGTPESRLSGRLIVIFGADAPTRLRARERLAELGAEVREVAPAYERNYNKDEIRQRIGGADLVVEVWRQLKHRDSEALEAALTGLVPQPARCRAAGSGKSSIVRAALEWAAQAA